MLNPDGSAFHVHKAAQPVSRTTLVGWAVVGVICWPGSLIALIGILFLSTRPVPGRRQPGLRMATRASFLAAIPLWLVGGAFSLPALTLIGAGLALMTWPLLWGHLLSLTRAGSRLRQEVLGIGVLVSTTLMSPMLLWALEPSMSMTLEPAAAAAMAILVSLALVVPALLWVMDRFWTSSSATAAELQAAVLRQCEPLGFQQAAHRDGLWLLGHRRGRRVELKVETRISPPQILAEVLLPEWPEGATARVRRAGESGGQSLSDPLLARLLIVEGLPDADRVLADLHEPLLGILHAWPGSVIAEGRILVHMPGPPLAADRVGEARQTPRWLAVFVVERLAAAVELANLLAPRLVRPRSVAETSPVRPAKQPT